MKSKNVSIILITLIAAAGILGILNVEKKPIYKVTKHF
jgi:Flp pilus assembly protein CpaB